MKTLQEQYILIKEGKGNKDHFLKQAKNLFPEYINPGTGIDTMYPEKDGYQSSIFLGDENSLFGMTYPQHVLKSKKNYNN